MELQIFHGSDNINDNNSYLNKVFSLTSTLRMGGLQEKFVLLPFLFFNLMKYKPEIIIMEGSSFMPNTISVYLYSKIFNVPYIIWGLGIIPHRKPWKYRHYFEGFINFFEKQASAFLCYSSYAEDYYSKKYMKPCYCAYNSIAESNPCNNITASDLNKKYENLKKLNITFIGRLIPQKNVDLLIKTMATIKIPSHLYILGNGELKEELEELVDNLKIRNRVTFLGEIYDKETKDKIFKKTHLGVLPGLGGLAIQEMLANGIPVITSYADGTELDLIYDAKGGIFLEDMNVKTLSRSIIKFYEMKTDKKIEMGLNGLEVIKKKYNLDTVVETILNVIKSFN